MIILDPSEEQNLLPTSPSINVQNWKCRECGFINKDRNTICDTCQSPKSIHPHLETRTSYTEKCASISPSNRRNPSPEYETMYNRAGSQSPSRERRKSSHSYSSDDNQYQSSRNIEKQRRSSKSKYHIKVFVFLSSVS